MAGVPAWVVGLVAAVALVLGFAVRRPAAVRPGRLVRLVPWSVIVFAVVLFAVVELAVEEGSSVLGDAVRHGRLTRRRSSTWPA